MRGFLLFILILFGYSPIASYAAAIHDAAKKGDVAAITTALDAGVDVNQSNGLATPLYYAIDGGHFEAAKLLIERGADVNATTIWGPALMPAVANCKIELMTLLLKKGANPNSDFQSKTALHVAVERGYLDCVMALVEAGANVNAQTMNIGPPIHFAKLNNHRDVADYLMTHGVIIPRPEPISAKLAAADPGNGQIIFNSTCARCHFIEPQKGRKIGPNLWAVVGRDKASMPEGGYSETLQA